MAFGKFLSLTAAAALLGAAAGAQSYDPQIQSIVDDLAGKGYSRIEIKRNARGLAVEAYGNSGRIEQRFDRSGNLVAQEVSDGTASRYSSSDRTRSTEHASGYDDSRDESRSGADHGRGRDDSAHDRSDDHGGDRGSGRDDDHGGGYGGGHDSGRDDSRDGGRDDHD
jgi:hypothetical protein